MARGAGQNSISGPHSALTDFLRENNIRASTVAYRNRARRARTPENQEAEAGPSNTNQTEENGVAEPNGQNGTGEDLESDGLDESEDEEATRATKRRRTTKGKGKAVDQETPKTKRAKAAAKRKAKKAANGDDDDDYEDSDDDEYTAPARGLFSPSKKTVDPSARPPNGSFEECAECGKDFTVTRYTVPSSGAPGWLCHDCAQASGIDPFKKPPPRRRKLVADKRQVLNFEELERVVPLATMCINLITQNLDSVEALGDIGTMNTNEILRVIASRRSLTPENAQLFYSIENTSLRLYDATNLTAPAFCALGALNPNLQYLHLDYCGQLTSEALLELGNHLPGLKRLELLGPFLVRANGWQQFFEITAQPGRMLLEGFLITQSPRFDMDCLECLIEKHPMMVELRLNEIGKMNDEWLKPLEGLTCLTSLELRNSGMMFGPGLTDGAVNKLLEAIGGNLHLLDLSSQRDLTDEVLLEGIGEHCHTLTNLVLSDLPELSDLGVAKFFGEWSLNPALEKIDMSRCHELGTRALDAISKHSGERLVSLNINSWKELGTEALVRLVERSGDRLGELDVSWCRMVDNFVMRDVLEKCVKLRWVKCYGCNRLNEECPKKPGLAIFGLEAHTAIRKGY